MSRGGGLQSCEPHAERELVQNGRRGDTGDLGPGNALWGGQDLGNPGPRTMEPGSTAPHAPTGARAPSIPATRLPALRQRWHPTLRAKGLIALALLALYESAVGWYANI